MNMQMHINIKLLAYNCLQQGYHLDRIGLKIIPFYHLELCLKNHMTLLKVFHPNPNLRTSETSSTLALN